MRLTTRIVGFEWLLVGLLVTVCALSIELIGSGGDQAAATLRSSASHRARLDALREALWHHELTRIRGEAAPREELYAARARFSRALDAAQVGSSDSQETTQLQALASVSDRYLNGEIAVKVPLESLQALDDLMSQRTVAGAEALQSTSGGGVTLVTTIGAAALLLAFLLTARASRRITQPLETLHRTVVALTQPGNTYRRVPDGDYDETLRELGRAVNLLAERLESSEGAPDRSRVLLESLCAHLIEQVPRPSVVVDLSGCVRLSNAAARDLLSDHTPGELGVPEAVKIALSDPESLPEQILRLEGPDQRPIGFVLRLDEPKTV